jgi:hypothetical protein
MAAPASQLTVQAIADSLGVKLPDGGLLVITERAAHSFMRDVLRQAISFYHSTRAHRLTVAHIEMALEALNLDPLQGYQVTPGYVVNPVSVEQCDVYPVQECPRALASVVEYSAPSAPALLSHGLRWTLIEGAFCGHFFPVRRREIPKRSISLAFVSSRNCALPRSPSEAFSLGDDGKKCANDYVSADEQQFFFQAINLLRADTVHSADVVLEALASEQKLQALVPYFLYWICGNMAIKLDRCIEMRTIVRVALALANNRWIGLGVYVHAFLKIGITGLLAASIDDDEVRVLSARLLRIVADRCDAAFPDIRTALANAFFGAMMDPETSLAAHYGALLGLKDLKIPLDQSHLTAYGSIITAELSSTDPTQCTWAARIFAFLYDPDAS